MESRYIAFTQQPYCCVPACLQMVMYRHGIPLFEQEVLGYELGLIVPEADVHSFNKVRTGEKPSSGWGTQIQNPDFELNKAFVGLNIPLGSRVHKIDTFKSSTKLKKFFAATQEADSDVLVCYKEGGGGHVCVFDRFENDDVWLVDPERNRPKHRKVKLSDLYEAMREHGAANYAGCWQIDPIR